MNEKYKLFVRHGDLVFAVVYEWFDLRGDNQLVPFGNFYVIMNGRRFGNRRFRYELDFALYRILELFENFQQKPDTYFPELLQESSSVLEEAFQWSIEKFVREEGFGEDPMPDAEFFERFKKFNENIELWVKANDNIGLSDGYHFVSATQIRWAYIWADAQEKLFIKDGLREEEVILPVGTCRRLLLELKEKMASTGTWNPDYL
jgi:hypothetical protein